MISTLVISQAAAGSDVASGAVLTLLLPLLLVFVVAGLWFVALRRSRGTDKR
jgi:uncharacterized ion transporter superfamily protein YfcC